MRIAFIGLGIMGQPMAKNLLKNAHEVYAYDIVPAAVEKAAQAGAIACKSAREAAQQAEVVLTIVPDAPDVDSVLFGEEGAAQGAKAGTLIIDMSSLAPDASRAISKKAVERGLRFLDAPVSGGEPKAIDGTLAFMVGGDEVDFNEALGVLKGMGASFVHVGAVGAGCAAKLANQIIVNLNIAALSEAMILLSALGVDRQKVFDAIRGGLAGSAVMEAKAPMMIAGDFTPGGRLDINMKDIRNVINAKNDLALTLPMTAQLYETMQFLKRHGMMGLDHSGIARFYEVISGLTIKE